MKANRTILDDDDSEPKIRTRASNKQVVRHTRNCERFQRELEYSEEEEEESPYQPQEVTPRPMRLR